MCCNDRFECAVCTGVRWNYVIRTWVLDSGDEWRIKLIIEFEKLRCEWAIEASAIRVPQIMKEEKNHCIEGWIARGIITVYKYLLVAFFDIIFLYPIMPRYSTHLSNQRKRRGIFDEYFFILGTFVTFALTSSSKSHRYTNFIVFVHASMYSDKLSSRESVPLFT